MIKFESYPMSKSQRFPTYVCFQRPQYIIDKITSRCSGILARALPPESRRRERTGHKRAAENEPRYISDSVHVFNTVELTFQTRTECPSNPHQTPPCIQTHTG